jgi:hypothetical protein
MAADIRALVIRERCTGRPEPDVHDGAEDDVVARHRLDLTQ